MPAAMLSLTLASCSKSLIEQCRDHRSRTAIVLRCLAFAGGIVLIHTGDFRLNNTSRDASIVFVTFVGLAELVASFGHTSPDSFLVTGSKLSALPIQRWPVLAIIPLGIVAYYEDMGRVAFFHLPTGPLLLLKATVASTLMSYDWGGMLLRQSSRSASEAHSKQKAIDYPPERVALLLALSGLTTMGSCFFLESAGVLSWWQSIGFAVAFSVSVPSTAWGMLLERSDTPTEEGKGDDKNRLSLERVQSASEVASSSGHNFDLESNCSLVAPGPTQTRRPRASICAGILCLLLGYSATLFQTPPSVGNARLDLDFRPEADLDIVVAVYGRPSTEILGDVGQLLQLPNFDQLNTHIYLYNKGPKELELGDQAFQYFPNQTEVTVIDLENLGREGATYLHHIVSRWDNLASHTVFMQENPHDFALMQRRVQDYFVPETGFMSLSYAGVVLSDCQYPHDRTWWQAPEVIRALQNVTMPEEECRDLVLTYRGQFLVSGARIRGNAKALYRGLLQSLEDPESWMHAPELTQSRWNRDVGDSLESPIIGYTLERMWGVIMQCSNQRLAYWSPSLLGSYVRVVWFGSGFALEDVQCLDR